MTTGGKTIEFEIDGKRYRAERPGAIEQWDIARRVLPALFESAQKGGPPDLIAWRAFATLTPADDVVVRDRCLAVISREDRGGWQRFVAANGQLMYQDVDWPVVMQLIQKVIDTFIVPFSEDPAQSSSGERPGSGSNSSPPSAPGSSDQPSRVSASTSR